MAIHPISKELGPPLKHWPLPGKLLATACVVAIGFGFVGALGQAIVHDIIPTFYNASDDTPTLAAPDDTQTIPRGDLFSATPNQSSSIKKTPWFQSEEFIFALKFTHIHIFGMSGIFLVMGAFALFLDKTAIFRAWLVILPFFGVAIDLAAVWLKVFIDPVFFWLHLPGGMLIVTAFGFGAILILKEAWFSKKTDRQLGQPL